MTNIEKRILLTFERAFPNLSEREKGWLLGLGEGLAGKAEEQREREQYAGAIGEANRNRSA